MNTGAMNLLSSAGEIGKHIIIIMFIVIQLMFSLPLTTG